MNGEKLAGPRSLVFGCLFGGLFWVILILGVLAVSCRGDKPPMPDQTPTIGEAATLTPPTATPSVSAPRGQGTVVARTPVVGYLLTCSNGRVTWRVYALAIANDVAGWPPTEEC